MTAGIYNFTIEQYDRFLRVLTWKDATGALVNLTGFSAVMKIRSVTPSDGAVITLSTTPNEAGDGIALGGDQGTITILISGATTSTLRFSEAKYTLELVDPSGEPSRLLKGALSLDEGIPND